MKATSLDLARNLKAAREFYGWQQAEVAEMVHIPAGRLALLECDARLMKVYELVRLADLYLLSAHQLTFMGTPELLGHLNAKCGHLLAAQA